MAESPQGELCNKVCMYVCMYVCTFTTADVIDIFCDSTPQGPAQTVWPFVFLNLEEMYGNIEMVHLSQHTSMNIYM